MQSTKQKAFTVLLSVTILAGTAGGCSIARFRQPDELPPTNGVAATKSNGEENAQPVKYDSEDLVFDKQLELPSGAVTAVYHAALPVFSETGDKAPILKKINEYYEVELEALQQDCESYFSQIQASYGEAWQTAAQPVAVYTVDFTYEIVSAEGGRISVIRTYRYMDINMKEKVVYSCETFDCTTGWPIKMAELFISDTEKVEAALNEQLDAWCGKNEVDRTLLPDISLKKQDCSFAISDDTLYLCLDENGMSSVSPGARLIDIPLDGLSGVMEQKSK